MFHAYQTVFFFVVDVVVRWKPMNGRVKQENSKFFIESRDSTSIILMHFLNFIILCKCWIDYQSILFDGILCVWL